MHRIRLVLDDITRIKVDAIVNAANKTLSGGCNTGEAKITKGYNLPAKYVIHTVGPIYGNENGREAELLADCYINSLNLAKEKGIKTIAFPAISAGVYGYPMEEQAKIVMQTLKGYVKDDVWFEEIDLVLHSQAMYEIYQKYYGEN